MGGVAPVPMERKKVEAFLAGRKPDEALAEAAAELAVEGTAPWPIIHIRYRR